MSGFDAAAAASELRRDITVVGELPLASRRRLIASLSQQLGGGHRGHMFLAILGLRCAKRAWPVWRSRFPSESGPLDLAESAVTALAEGAKQPVSSADLGGLTTYLDNKLVLGERYFPAVAAGFAALAVVRDVLDPSSSLQGDAASELDTDPESWDPCFHASVAVSGGATWENVGDAFKRQEFWNWYLTSAIPEAFAEAANVDHPK